MVRLADKKDYEGVLKIVKEVHQLHADARPDIYRDIEVPMERAYFDTLIDQPNVSIFIIDKRDEIVAYAILRIEMTRDIPVIQHKKFIYIDDFAVKSNHYREGHGKELFNAIKSFSKDQGIDSILLTVSEFNKRATDFYEAIGMKTRNRKMEIDID